MTPSGSCRTVTGEGRGRSFFADASLDESPPHATATAAIAAIKSIAMTLVRVIPHI
jgi:hypothetical protein